MQQMDEGRVNGSRVLAILREEAPLQFELACRRAIIEQQAEMIEAMREALSPEMAAAVAAAAAVPMVTPPAVPGPVVGEPDPVDG